MAQTLYETGPISHSFNVLAEEFVFYESGVYSSETCNIEGSVIHDMVAVGYGVDNYGEEYWVSRNSWGPYWG